MPIKVVKPTTPGRRNMSYNDFSKLSKKKPEKSLTKKIVKKAGRNNQGRLTVRHKGGGHKRKYRIIDFKRNDKIGITAKVKSIEYDPNRTAFIALIAYSDGEKRYIISPEGLKIDDLVITNEKTKLKVGNRMQIKNILPGFNIYNIELHRGKGGQIVRSAGNSAKVMSVEGEMAQIQLPSKEIRLVDKNCYATIGIISNSDHSNIRIGKAGRNRWKGKRPQVTGKSMNPCDHPHGGGEGHTDIGMKTPKTPWGMPALGFKTRKRKYTNKYILQRRK